MDPTIIDDHYLHELIAHLDAVQGIDRSDKPAGAAINPPMTEAEEPSAGRWPHREFIPIAPNTLAESRLSGGLIQTLIFKFLMNTTSATGRDIAFQLGLPFGIVSELLSTCKDDQLIVHKSDAALGDYVYQLTGAGTEDAQRYSRNCTYYGTAPVHLDDYIMGVHAQSITRQRPSVEDLDEAFSDMLVSSTMLSQIGQAVHAGQGFFLYGNPGNGKTTLAERVTRVFGQTIWIPRALDVDGEIIRLFDPCNHVEMPLEDPPGLLASAKIDRRWVRIRRPAIVTGGELTMDRLEITVNATTGVCEAPLQLKSNCGSLIIDDFGRQRISTRELLNRWIVPLDRRYDFLNLPSGKTIQVPFDQLLIFSTNLEPRDLVDEAFLRRIPYKIEATNPSESEFRRLFLLYTDRLGVEYSQEALDHLIKKHFKAAGRSYRCCHARDLVLQVRNFCEYHKLPVKMSPQAIDVAVKNYFAVLG